VIDDFNDGVISAIWNAGASDNASVYEANGVLNVYVGAGLQANGWNQVAGIRSRDFILQGDFDVQVDFQLSSDYHSAPGANTKLFLTDQEGDGLEISIRSYQYLSLELPVGGPAIIYNSTPTAHLAGKLRIKRVGNLVATYFWETGWQSHAQWQATTVAGDLIIDIDSWNWWPEFRAFSTKFDNVLISNGLVTICHKPGTPAQKTLTIPAQALNGHLGHGDTIGSCE
jgi:hypothetical protein